VTARTDRRMMSCSLSPGASGQTPAVTVVVACYNHGEYVEQALASVFSQDYPNVEVIVTDDASTDGNQTVIRDLLLANGWNARTIFHSRNAGICPTFNEALEQVATPYVAFLAADDWCDHTRIRKQVQLLEEDPEAAFVFGPVILVDEDGSARERQWLDFFSDDWPGTRIENPFFELLKENWIPAPSVLSRTSNLKDAGGFDEALPFEDWDTWLRLLRTHRIRYCAEPLVFYRQTPGSAWSSLRKSSRAAELQLARLAMYAKHYGCDTHTDRLLFDLSYGAALAAWEAGVDPALVRHILRDFAMARKSLRAFFYWTLARSGVNGRVFENRRKTIRDSFGMRARLQRIARMDSRARSRSVDR